MEEWTKYIWTFHSHEFFRTNYFGNILKTQHQFNELCIQKNISNKQNKENASCCAHWPWFVSGFSSSNENACGINISTHITSLYLSTIQNTLIENLWKSNKNKKKVFSFFISQSNATKQWTDSKHLPNM